MYRFVHSMSFRVCITISLVLALTGSALSFLSYVFADDFMVLLTLLYPEDIISEMVTQKPAMSSLLSSFSASGLPMFMSTIAVSNFLTAEFTSSTIRNLAAKGFGRVRIYLSKLLSCFFGMLLIAVPIGLINVGINLAFFGYDGTGMDTLRTVQFFAMNLLSWFTYAAIFTALSMIIKSGAAVMTINILLITISAVVFALLDVPLSSLGISIGKYWVVNFTGSMISYDFAQQFLLICSVGAACYAIASTVIGILVFCKTDIK